MDKRVMVIHVMVAARSGVVTKFEEQKDSAATTSSTKVSRTICCKPRSVGCVPTDTPEMD